MKKILSFISGFALIPSFIVSPAWAQPCNNVSSIGINTGYNYNTSTVVATGQPDPEWRVTELSPDCSAVSGAVSVGANARVCTPYSGWLSGGSTSRWISFLNAGTYATPSSGTYGMVLTRTFRVCEADSFIFNLRIANDNFCSLITIDGTPLSFSQPPSSTTSNYTSMTTITPFSMWLTAGTHTINVRIMNFPVASQSNPHGLMMTGNISSMSGSNSLVGPGSAQDCTCSSNCSDTCYWKVSGNNIIGSNNIFGTLNPFSINIRTNNNERGIITQGGSNSSDMSAGRLGWNTMNPTARLHVNCLYGNNPQNSVNGTSDIRFEHLEPGKGTVLVIDDKGYVYDSKISIANFTAMEEQITSLQEEIAQLKRQQQTSEKETGALLNTLSQNVPNPFNKETIIGYNIQDMQQSAFIVIHDLNGKEIQKYPIPDTGKGKIVFNGGTLQSGVYLYTLVVDGRKTDTKKMILIE